MRIVKAPAMLRHNAGLCPRSASRRRSADELRTINSNGGSALPRPSSSLFLGLAMLEAFEIDLLRFGSNLSGPPPRASRDIRNGALSAVLAGACVAPVVIAVLLQAAPPFRRGYYRTAAPSGARRRHGAAMAFGGGGLSVLPNRGLDAPRETALGF
jgi:hypothetical protein